MKRMLTAVLGAALAHIVAPASAQKTAMVGFKEASVQVQRELEEQYDSHLKVHNLRRWMKHMTERPHHAGSPKARENAEFMAQLFEEWGYETEIETFHVLFPTPKVRELVLLEPERLRRSSSSPPWKMIRFHRQSRRRVCRHSMPIRPMGTSRLNWFT